MLVPRFSMKQTDDEVVVTLKLPYVRVGDAELSVDGHDLAFYCKPYLLKLRFPHPLRGSEEDEGKHCRAVYDADLDHGTMTLHLAKASPGLHFPDLDLTTSLLQPMRSFPGLDGASASRGPSAASPAASTEPPAIEVLRSEEYMPAAATTAGGGGEDDSTTTPGAAAPSRDANEEETKDEEALPPLLVGAPRYGFNRQYSGVFAHLREEMVGVLRLEDPEGTPEALRTQLREAAEEEDFDAERYLGDLGGGGEEDPVYVEAMALEPFWAQQQQQELTEAERAEMGELRNREYLVETAAERRGVMLGLLDLLFAFAYDHRTTGGEPTVESCWTVATLSPALSWLETWTASPEAASVRAVVRAFYRRSLAYPYLRMWALAARCVEDVGLILAGGRRVVLRCLLRVRAILRRTETHYLLNRVVVDDYCVFLQQPGGLAEEMVATLREALAACKVGKGDVGLDIPAVEALLTGEGKEEDEEQSSSGGEESESESDSDEDEEESSSSEEEEEEDEAEEQQQQLVAAIEQVRIGDGDARPATAAAKEEKEDDDMTARLAALSVAATADSSKEKEKEGSVKQPRETLEVAGATPARLLVVGAGKDGTEAQAEAEAGEGQPKKRILIEELSSSSSS